MDAAYVKSLKQGDLFRYNCRSPASINVPLPNGGFGKRYTPMFKPGSVGVLVTVKTHFVCGLFDPADLMPDFLDVPFSKSLVPSILDLWVKKTGKNDVYPVVHDCQIVNTDPYQQ